MLPCSQKRKVLPWMCTGAWVLSSLTPAVSTSNSGARSRMLAALSVPVTWTDCGGSPRTMTPDSVGKVTST